VRELADNSSCVLLPVYLQSGCLQSVGLHSGWLHSRGLQCGGHVVRKLTGHLSRVPQSGGVQYGDLQSGGQQPGCYNMVVSKLRAYIFVRLHYGTWRGNERAELLTWDLQSGVLQYGCLQYGSHCVTELAGKLFRGLQPGGLQSGDI
jgi:hypothetical protein